jgi:ribonuclease HII
VYNKIFLFDEEIRKRFKVEFLAGVDEVGRGCVFGPIVAAAVVFDSNVYIPHLKESKSISSKTRKKLFREIYSKAKAVSCSILSIKLINKFGIGKANQLVIEDAVKKLNIEPDIVIVDGYPNPYIKNKQYAVIDADEKSAVVAAASVVAKVVRDYILDVYYKFISSYDLDNNKGYLTSKHLKEILQIGLCDFHRHYAYKFINNLVE